MAGDEVRVWFDKAYSKMSLGDFAAAAECFEHVIKHCGDANAARIAEQRIQWYCVPLDAILKKMDECQNPIDIYNVLAELFAADVIYVESEQNYIIQAVEEELHKLSTVIRLGNRVWARKEIFSASLENLAQEIQRSPSPISISKWIKEKFIECDLPENFPDHITLEVYEGGLRQFPIHIFGNEFTITEEAWGAQVNFLANHIMDAGNPVSLSSILKLLFPGISPELETQIAPSIPAQLDSRFIEVTPGQIFLRDLLKLNSDKFEELFGLSLEPKSTTSVVCFSLFPGQSNQVLTQRFHPIAEEHLAHNPNLINLRHSKWLAKALANELYAQAEAFLLQAGTIQSAQAILDKISKTTSVKRENQQLFISLIENHLNNCIDVIGIGNQVWIHSSFFRQAADRSYQELLVSTRALATVALIKTNLAVGKSNITQGLILQFEKFLSQDGRFVSEPGQNSRIWRTVDSRKRDNQSVYEIFRRVHKLLTIKAIENLLGEEKGITEPVMDLEDDERFNVFPLDRWGLAEWVLINDYTFEYLLSTHKSLHEIAIRGIICDREKIKEENAIFIPTEDVRFAQDTISRWFCRYSLVDTDLELLYQELIKYGGSGRKIGILIKQILYKDADATNAVDRLQADERFIHLEELWFARDASFYALTAEDMEKVYQTLVKQSASRHAIPIKDLIYNAIGRDGRLTDADVWLSKDPRFVQVHDNFWTLSNAATPDFGRLGIGGVAVHNPEGDRLADGSGLAPIGGELTRRKPRSSKPEAEQELRKKDYRTLSHLDIRHGNLRISGLLKEWIPGKAENVHFKDEEDFEYIAPIDETHSILNIHEWIIRRNLTYGDKISIQPIPQGDELFICPYGTRDATVYQAAIDHQKEIDKLIAEARRVNKSFHDLMIEVMEELNYPLHREDIYQLVNYQRTANLSTISEILSLPDCPFEELRYFIPVGGGNWKFDRIRKEAFDMKMQELLAENGKLQNQLSVLQIQLESQADSQKANQALSEKIELFQSLIAETNDKVGRLQDENSSLARSNSQRQEELNALRIRIPDLEARIKESQTAFQNLQAGTGKEKAEYQERIDTLSKQQENKLEAAQERIENLLREIEQVKTENSSSAAKVEADLTTSQANNEQLQAEVEQLRTENSSSVAKVEADLTTSQANNEQLQAEVERLRNEKKSSVAKVEAKLTTSQANNEQLHGEIERLRSESKANSDQLDAVLTAAKVKVDSLQQEIDQMKKGQAERTSKLETDLESARATETNLHREIEQLEQEKTEKTGQLEAELASARTQILQLGEKNNSLAPASFKEIMQAFSSLIFHKKAR